MMMKKYVTISLFVSFVIITSVLTAGLISLNKNQAVTIPNTNSVNQVGEIPGVNSNMTTLALSISEVIKHKSASSCWLLISGKIYDVTTFLNQHPGNASTILPNCGTDATVAYNTKGRTNGNPHSGNAVALLAAYFIGNLNQTVTTSPNNPTTPPIANPNPVIPRGDDDDD